jgi:hypothetical protein
MSTKRFPQKDFHIQRSNTTIRVASVRALLILVLVNAVARICIEPIGVLQKTLHHPLLAELVEQLFVLDQPKGKSSGRLLDENETEEPQLLWQHPRLASACGRDVLAAFHDEEILALFVAMNRAILRRRRSVHGISFAGSKRNPDFEASTGIK